MYFNNEKDFREFLHTHEFTVKTENGKQLNKCTAWACDAYVVIDGEKRYFKALKSYNTVVAIACKSFCYVLGYWSNTTVQHCYKFARSQKCNRIYYLYKRTDGKTMYDADELTYYTDKGIRFYP